MRWIFCRWNRDLSQQVPRTELTRFPHAVLDIQMDPSTLHNPPAWLEVRPLTLQRKILPSGFCLNV